ncbi:Epidermal growth factor receptor substrate 15-like 1 [Larimichthys crocea]|uniref:Uncharacterized protein n=1 Tax=Larimichthys crocea TaxID=215358 RepID=A0ACD3QS18_LARCR|nr:Epidermal growth factor receptor substrate 15-like 1 [Larimichthys crocea]
MFNNNSSAKEPPADPFQTEDPFKSDPFTDPFGGDPFKESDPFKGTSSEDFFKRTDKTGPVRILGPLCQVPSAVVTVSHQTAQNRKIQMCLGQRTPLEATLSEERRVDLPTLVRCQSLTASEPTQPSVFSAVDSKDSFVTTHSSKTSKDCPVGFADFGSFGSENQQLEWAKRESEREEQERLRRLRLQEQQDLELAIALSRADMPSS